MTQTCKIPMLGFPSFNVNEAYLYSDHLVSVDYKKTGVSNAELSLYHLRVFNLGWSNRSGGPIIDRNRQSEMFSSMHLFSFSCFLGAGLTVRPNNSFGWLWPLWWGLLRQPQRYLIWMDVFDLLGSRSNKVFCRQRGTFYDRNESREWFSIVYMQEFEITLGDNSQAWSWTMTWAGLMLISQQSIFHHQRGEEKTRLSTESGSKAKERANSLRYWDLFYKERLSCISDSAELSTWRITIGQDVTFPLDESHGGCIEHFDMAWFGTVGGIALLLGHLGGIAFLEMEASDDPGAS